jgi:diaminopimelate epimerase
MFNPDGSEDFCGNGLRCAAWHGHRRGRVGDAFSIRHLGRTVAARVRPDGQVTVVLPPASFAPGDVPVLATGDPVRLEFDGFLGTAVSTGSTHLVVLVGSLPEDPTFFDLSPRIETDPRFPERTSVIWTRLVGPGQLEVRIWERGVGETLGCGTGSVAAAVVAARESGQTGRIEVMNPGGLLVAEFDSWEGPVASTTRPVVVYEGRLSERPGTAASRLASLR